MLPVCGQKRPNGFDETSSSFYLWPSWLDIFDHTHGPCAWSILLAWFD